LSMLATRSSERVRDVFDFIRCVYYQSSILAILEWSIDCADAKVLGVTRQALNNLVNERTGA
jgi:hypothetical protein